MDKLKADLAYFRDDFRNVDMFKAIPRPTGNTPCLDQALELAHQTSWTHQWEALDQLHPEETLLQEILQCHPQDHPSPTT